MTPRAVALRALWSSLDAHARDEIDEVTARGDVVPQPPFALVAVWRALRVRRAWVLAGMSSVPVSVIVAVVGLLAAGRTWGDVLHVVQQPWTYLALVAFALPAPLYRVLHLNRAITLNATLAVRVPQRVGPAVTRRADYSELTRRLAQRQRRLDDDGTGA